MKQKFLLFLMILSMTFLTGCSKQNSEIYLFTREEGSGTREQFVNVLDIVQDGFDAIDTEASVSNSSAVILSAVKRNKNAIGYISAAAVNESVKAISVNGIMPSKNNMQLGKYALMRDFSLVYYADQLDEVAYDFLKFTESPKAVAAMRDMGYLPAAETKEYKRQKMKGKLVIAGSASVSPLMEVLREKYTDEQPDVEIEVQQNDSSTGLSLVDQKIVNIAMTSRPVKPEEISSGYTSKTLAKDGIAVIVHPENKVQDLSFSELKRVFSGEIKNWSQISDA